MLDTVRPFLPAIGCTILCVIAIAGNLIGGAMTGAAPPWIGNGDIAFYSSLPMCFALVGVFQSKLQRENRELRKKFEELVSRRSAKDSAA